MSSTATIEHKHAYRQWAQYYIAPIGEPPAHTTFSVLVCDCGTFETFPEQNYEMCTAGFQVALRGMMMLCGYHPLWLVEEAQELVEAGGTHECHEWRTGHNRCILCGRQLSS